MTVSMEAKDLNTLKLDQLVKSLITHEMITSNDDKKKKKDIALKASNFHDDDEDEEMAFLSRKFRIFLIRKKEGNLKFSKSDNDDVLKCYKYREPRHMMAKTVIYLKLSMTN